MKRKLRTRLVLLNLEQTLEILTATYIIRIKKDYFNKQGTLFKYI